MIPSFAGYVIREYRADWALYFTASSDVTPDIDWEIVIEWAFKVTPHDADGYPGESFKVEVKSRPRRLRHFSPRYPASASSSLWWATSTG